MSDRSILAWDNALNQDGASLDVTTEASGYAKENLKDERPHLVWKGTGTAQQEITLDAGADSADIITATCLGIHNHDLFTQGASGVVLQYSNNAEDSAPVWTNCHSPVTPTDDKTIFKTFNSVSARWFRLLIPAGYTAAPYIGVLFIGEYMAFPRLPSLPFDPDGVKPEFESQRSRGGNFLGVVEKYRDRSYRLQFEHLDPDWVADNYVPFFNSHAGGFFFFGIDITAWPSKVFYMEMDRPELSAPYEQNALYRTINLSLIGKYE